MNFYNVVEIRAHSKVLLLVILLKVPLNFFPFLDDLGNFKHSELYLFFSTTLATLSKVSLIRALLNNNTVEVHSLSSRHREIGTN